MARKSRNWALLCVIALVLSACGKKGPDTPAPAPVQPAPGQPEKPTPPAPPVPSPHPPAPPVPPTPPVPPPAPEPDLTFYHHASLWAHHVSNSISWTRTVVSIVHNRLHDFERARDVETFCPGYGEATTAQREVCWLRLVGGVVEFESSFQPEEPPFYEGNGVYSVGLMALSTGECSNAPTQKALMDPVENLICGVNKMAALIIRGHAIDSDENGGAAAYWSTLRPPHKVQLPSGRWAIIGKKDEIIDRTRTFKQFH